MTDGGAVRAGRGRVAVVALGSILEGDDGAGPAALADLVARWELPPEVEPLDLGAPGSDLVEHLRGYDAVVILDAVRSELPPGTVVVENDPARFRSAPARMSPQDPNLGQAIDELALTGELPEDVIVIGVVPLRVGVGTKLSDEVAASVPILAEMVANQLRRLGAPARLRESPAELDRWPERTTSLSI